MSNVVLTAQYSYLFTIDMVIPAQFRHFLAGIEGLAKLSQHGNAKQYKAFLGRIETGGLLLLKSHSLVMLIKIDSFG